MLLINFYFMIHFDFYNTKIFSFSIGSKVMNPKMPLCQRVRVKNFGKASTHLHGNMFDCASLLDKKQVLKKHIRYAI